MLTSMGGAARKAEIKPNTHTGFFHWDETLQCGSVQFCLWEGQVPASSTLVFILETATSNLIRYLSGRDVSTTSGLPPFSQAETSTHELFQFSFYTKSTWSAQTSFITSLNNLDNFSPKQRQRAHVLWSVVTSGRKAVIGSWGIGVTSQEFSNHLRRNGRKFASKW